MTGVVALQSSPMSGQAFAVNWSDIEKWDVFNAWLKSGVHVTHPLVPLGTVVRVRWEQATPQQIASREIVMLDRVSFDGQVFVGRRIETKMEQFIAHPGDLVVSKIRARQGSVGVVQAEHGKVGVTIHYRVLQPDPKRVNVTFGWLALRSSFCRVQFLAATGGAMKGEISEEALLALKLPLPPLSAQRAIVDRWMAVQAQILAAHQRVEKLKEKADADFLASLGYKDAGRKVPPKVFAAMWVNFDRWSVRYNQQILIGVNLENGKYSLVTLGSLITLAQYGTSEKANSEGHGCPVLRICNIKEQAVDLADLKHIDLPPKTLNSLTLKDGDMLVIRTSGSRDLVGTCSVFHETEKMVFASYLIRLRFDSERVNPDYLNCLINSALGRQQVDSVSRQIMQNNINSEELRSLRIPLPPLSVQQKLVERIGVARAEVGRERVAVAELAANIAAEVEAMILGQKQVRA